jgi:methylmalonyl-CoA mutase
MLQKRAQFGLSKILPSCWKSGLRRCTSQSKGKYPSNWEKLARKELGNKEITSLEWNTPEGITIKPLYTQLDNDGIKVDEKEVEAPGIYPYKRGPYATMFTAKPWTIRQYAGMNIFFTL